MKFVIIVVIKGELGRCKLLILKKERDCGIYFVWEELDLLRYGFVYVYFNWIKKVWWIFL